MVPNEDDIYVCRCEEVTVGDIKRAIAAGACSVRDIKVRTNATMGVCQGMTCRRNIERMLREQKNRAGPLLPAPAVPGAAAERGRSDRHHQRGGG